MALLLAVTPASAQSSDFGAFAVAVRHEIAAGHIPGAVLVYGEEGRVVYRRAFGARSYDPPEALRPDTIFDLASLTKVIATTTAAMQLVEQGRLDLDSPVADYWPAFAQNGKAAITVRELMTHSSGLPPDLALDRDWGGEAQALERAAAVRPEDAPGSSFRYSDINFIVLGALVERISGEPLDVYADRHIFGPLGMADTGFRPPRSRLDRIAATDRESGVPRQGVVQDPTACRMGGVAGHAGLFSTAEDIARFAEMLLNGGSLEGVRILKPQTIAEMIRPESLPGGIERALGWDISSPYSAGMDAAFAEGSFGHTGYTGGLLWIDPVRRRFLILLTSRLYPDGRGDVRPLRLALAQAVERGSIASADIASSLPHSRR